MQRRFGPTAVPVKIRQSVVLLVGSTVWAGCSSAPTAPAPSTAAAASALPFASAAAASEARSGFRRPRAGGPCEPLRPSDSPPPATSSDATASSSSSAYPGCGRAIPPDRLWDETTESEVLSAIGAAKTCAAEHDRRLLLEFVAPWCDDCREMAKLDETSVVSETLKARFERVRINVGKWDRHEALRKSFDVRALATYIVIDPKTSRQLAKTTLEPVTKKGAKLSAEDWARWLSRY